MYCSNDRTECGYVDASHNDDGECFMVDHNAGSVQNRAAWRGGAVAFVAKARSEMSSLGRRGRNAAECQCLPRVSKERTLNN